MFSWAICCWQLYIVLVMTNAKEQKKYFRTQRSGKHWFYELSLWNINFPLNLNKDFGFDVLAVAKVCTDESHSKIKRGIWQMAHVQNGSGQVSFSPLYPLRVGGWSSHNVGRSVEDLYTPVKQNECRNQSNPEYFNYIMLGQFTTQALKQ